MLVFQTIEQRGEGQLLWKKLTWGIIWFFNLKGRTMLLLVVLAGAGNCDSSNAQD